MVGSIAYLMLQSTREGQAAHAHVHELIAGLRELGWAVELFEPEYEGDASPGILRRLREFRGVSRRLASRLGEFDILYVRSHPFAFPASRAAKRHGLPAVQESNGAYQDVFTAWPGARPLRPLIEAWQREQYRDAAALVAMSDELADWLRGEAPGVSVTTIPNGANTDLFTPDAPPLEGLPKRYVTFFGVLAKWQGVATILQATKAAEWPSGVSVVIAGDGTERGVVESAALRDTRIVYLGRIPYNDVPGLITGSIAGMSVQGEVPGRPMPSAVKVFEILACGRPAIVTAPSGTARFVREHDCGLVVPPDDSRALASAVARVASSPGVTTEAGKRGRQAVVALASWTIRAGQTAATLDRVLDLRGRPRHRATADTGETGHVDA